MAASKKGTRVNGTKAVIRSKMKKVPLNMKKRYRKPAVSMEKKVKFASNAKYDSSEDEVVSPSMEQEKDDNIDNNDSTLLNIKSTIQNEDDDDGVPASGNAGWADAMAKILGSSAPKDKPVLLAKAKMDRDVLITDDAVVASKPELEVVTENAEKETKPKLSLDERRKLERKQKYEQREKRIQWVNMARQKPNVMERDRERALSRIATKGVVQLFNAVKTQQLAINSKLKEAGGSERKREKVMKTVTKGAFLDVLKGKAKSIQVDNELENLSKTKDKDTSANIPTWHILRDDFMMGAKMTDWDKREEEEEIEAGDWT